MRPCPARDELERSLAWQPSPAGQDALAAHLRTCPVCQGQADTTPNTEILNPRPPEPGPPDPRGAEPVPESGCQTSDLAAQEVPTVRMWAPDLAPRPGERPVQAAPGFGRDLSFPDFPFPAGYVPRVEGYDILGEIGRGGMGVVYKARQVSLNRLVALKMIRAGELAEPDALARFRAEAQAIAALQHPNIVQVYEVGESDGRPYFSLEYVAGGNLAQAIAGRPQPPEAAAELVEALAGAIHFAHSQGVVHRDLKPANILLQKTEDRGQRTEEPGASPSSVLCPLSSGIPKVADFGLAKSTAAAADTPGDRPTGRGLIVGTPQYMAPEQATSGPAAVGPAVDVYALGAILYELLTGRPPFQGASAMDTLLHVRFLEPIAPRVWQTKLPRDLETICLKCLQKEPHKRYASAAALADDLRRFRRGEPITARPAGTAERAWRWARRYPETVALSALLLLAGVLGLAVLEWQRAQSESARRQAEQARDAALRAQARADGQLALAEAEIYRARIAQAHLHLQAGRADRAAALLGHCRPGGDRPDPRHWEWHYLSRCCRTGEANPRVLSDGPDAIMRVLGFRADGTLAVACGDRPAVQVGDAGAGTLRSDRALADAAADRTGGAAVSRDGRHVAAPDAAGTARVWDVDTGTVVAALPAADPRPVTALAFGPVGRLLATADGGPSAGRLRVWDWSAGRVVWEARTGEPVACLEFSPDGRTLAVGGGRVLELRDAATGAVRSDLAAELTGGVMALAFSPDGRLLAAVVDGEIGVWDVAAGVQSERLPVVGRLGGVAFSPDGQRLAAAGSDAVLLWDVAAGQPVLELPVPAGRRVDAGDIRPRVAFSPDGRRIAASTGAGVAVWDATPVDEGSKVP